MNKKQFNKKNTFETLILFRRSLIFQTKEFFQNSTLHGVRYIAESGRPLGEKFMWFCFTAVGAVTALVIIMSLWEKFQTNPTITGLDTDFQNQKVIFPAVAVCPDTPYDRNKAYDVAYRTLAQYDSDAAKQMVPFLLSLTMLSFKTLQTTYDFSKMFASAHLAEKSLRALAFDVRVSCEDTLVECKYRDERVSCCSHFDPVYTEHGFCYAFNSPFISYPDSDETALSAHDLYETDKKWALEFIPNSTSKIFIMSNNEYLSEDIKPHLEWRENQTIDARIMKRNTYTTDDARQLSIGQRKCIFPDEVKLEYYKGYYAITACVQECRMKKAIKLCRCLPPFYKPVPNIPICSINQFPCLVKYSSNITSMRDCMYCELSCSQTVFNIEKLSNINGEPADQNVVVEFLTWPIICFKREVLFGWVDLLVSFGGIASLFLGFSLLSGVEIIYYFTMRACCMVYRNRGDLSKIETEIKMKPPPMIDLSLVPKMEGKSKEPLKLIIKQEDHLLPEISGEINRRRNHKKFTGFKKPLYKSPKTLLTISYHLEGGYGGYLP